jgi:ankyrin repeat protein
MLRLGFDPACRGTDGGTALHMASWMGNVEMVERLLALGVAIDDVDPEHGSTPLGWAAFGSVQRCARRGDYVSVVERLVAAGANVKAPGNRAGRTMLSMAEGNPGVQQALRRLGAA